MKFSRRAMLGGTAAATLPIVVPIHGAWAQERFGPPAAICAATAQRAAIAAAFDEAARCNDWANGPVVTLALPWVPGEMSRLILRVTELFPVFAWDVGPASAMYDPPQLMRALDSASRTGARLLLVRDNAALARRLEQKTGIVVRPYSQPAAQTGAFAEPLGAELGQVLGRPGELYRLSTPRVLPLSGRDVAALFPAEVDS